MFQAASVGYVDYRFRPERELRLDDDLDPDDELDRPPDEDLLTLLPLDELDRETLRDPEDDDLDGFDALPGDLEDDLDDERDVLPDDFDDRDDERVSPVDRDGVRDSLEVLDPEEPDLLLRPVEASPLLRAGGLDVWLGYHSTPPCVRVVAREVVRASEPERPDEVTVEREPDRVVPERSTVRPPSLYLLRETVAVRVLTRVAVRVVLRVAVRVAVPDLDDADPVDPPVEERPTRTLPSSGSLFRVAERERSYPRPPSRESVDPYPVPRPSVLRRP